MFRLSPVAAVAAVAVGCAAIVIPSVASATPGTPAPTIQSVTAKLDQLAKQNEVLAERYNAATIDVATKQRLSVSAIADAAKAAAAFKDASKQFTDTLTQQYEGSTFSSTGALLTSANGADYLAQLNSLTLLSQHRAQVVKQLTVARAQAQSTSRTASELLATAKSLRASLATQRTQILADTAKYKQMLASLTLAQQLAYKARNAPTKQQVQTVVQAVNAAGPATVPSATQSTPSTTPTTPTTSQTPTPTSPSSSTAPSSGSSGGNSGASGGGISARAKTVLDYAIAQVGKSYVFAGSGPDSFDCSGLTMAAYAQIGISIPHNAEAQYGYGTHVSVDQLQPGDLIFLYSPISHVEIYVGGGMAVSAADEQLGIRWVNIYSDMGSWAGATRLL